MREKLSLLWPQNCQKSVTILEEQTVIDLDIQTTTRLFSKRKNVQAYLLKILTELPMEKEVIIHRQRILEDLLDNKKLRDVFSELQPQLESLQKYDNSNKTDRHPVRSMITRISELDCYVESLEKLWNAFELLKSPKSPAFTQLKETLKEAVRNEKFSVLKEELPTLKKKIRGIRSITIGVNLDTDLRPEHATLLSINTERFKGSQILKNIFNKNDKFTGLAELHTPETQGWEGEHNISDPTMIPLFKDLYELMRKGSVAVVKSLKKFESINTSFLSNLSKELTLFLGACSMMEELQNKGLSFCKPEVLDMEERSCLIKDYFNFNLSISCRPVTTDINFTKDDRAAVLTGPNGGGKTVFIQGVSITQILFQSGLYIPGTKASLSPVDGIYTHYQIEERPDENKGRFGEEAYRLNAIFNKATKYSLIIMNESFSSTNAGESLYLAEDIMKIIIKMGGWVIFATHMHALAEDKGNIGITSLICQVEESESDEGVKRLYKIVQAPPKGVSYAKQLANKYGISFDHLDSTLKSRGVLV